MTDPTATPAPTAPATAADRLYGDHAGTPAPVPSPTNNPATERLYGPTPSGDRSAQLYTPESTYGRYFDEGFTRMADQVGGALTPELISEARKGITEIFAELEIEPFMAERVGDLYLRHVAQPATQEQLGAWAQETRRAVRERYGAEAEDRLKMAREVVAANKKLHDLLAFTGLGSHPGIVLDLLERAPRLRAKLTR